MFQSIHLEDGIFGEHVAERDPIRGIQSNAIVPPRMPNGFEVFQACNTRHQVVDLVAHRLPSPFRASSCKMPITQKALTHTYLPLAFPVTCEWSSSPAPGPQRFRSGRESSVHR